MSLGGIPPKLIRHETVIAQGKRLTALNLDTFENENIFLFFKHAGSSI